MGNTMKLPWGKGPPPDLRKPLPRAYVNDDGEVIWQGWPGGPPIPGWAGYVDSKGQIWSFDEQGRLCNSCPLPMPPAPPAPPAPPRPAVQVVPQPCIHRWQHLGTNGIIVQRRCYYCNCLQKMRRDEFDEDFPPW